MKKLFAALALAAVVAPVWAATQTVTLSVPGGFVNGMVASHLLCHSGTINRHSLNGALLS